MILTVTLNPALDKTLEVTDNPPLATIRATRVMEMAGGKGINVARAAVRMGCEARCLAPLGGRSGQAVADLANAEGLELLAVELTGNTRSAITVRDRSSDRYWHYLEPGPEWSEAETATLRETFARSIRSAVRAVLSGSLPSTGAEETAAWMVSTAQELKRPIALDSFGPWALQSLQGGLWLTKPNLEEWVRTTGMAVDTPAQQRAAVSRMLEWGVGIAVLSAGAAGAWVGCESGVYRVHPPRVTEVNDLGGGDAMVAGFCVAASRRLGAEDAIRLAAACGAANAEVWDPCGIDATRVDQLVREVRLERA